MKAGRVVMPDGDSRVVLCEGDRVQPIQGPDTIVTLLAAVSGSAQSDGGSCALADVQVLGPVAVPPSYRDFMAFEAHIRNARASMGLDMDPGWYEAPVFYFGNPGSFQGPDGEVVFPSACRRMDFELEVACVIGRPGRDLDAEDPATLEVIAGFTLLNDWSARDLQAKEMRQGLGPAKGKDFATSIGPWLATPDEFVDFGSGRPKDHLTARVNGQFCSEGELSDLHFSWGAILARASADVTLVPGDVIGSGTCGSGCLLELRALHGADALPWLEDGDVVELESQTIGTLRSTVRRR